MDEDFDDAAVYRRRYLALEQSNGDLGETIGVLKKERADLHIALSELIAQKFDATVVEKAKNILSQIRIDK